MNERTISVSNNKPRPMVVPTFSDEPCGLAGPSGCGGLLRRRLLPFGWRINRSGDRCGDPPDQPPSADQYIGVEAARLSNRDNSQNYGPHDRTSDAVTRIRTAPSIHRRDRPLHRLLLPQSRPGAGCPHHPLIGVEPLAFTNWSLCGTWTPRRARQQRATSTRHSLGAHLRDHPLAAHCCSRRCVHRPVRLRYPSGRMAVPIGWP